IRGHVEHVLDAVDLVLQWSSNGLLKHLRRGAGIDGAHRHHGWGDFRILRNRQRTHRRQARKHQEYRQDGRKDRAVDKEARKHAMPLTYCLLFLAGCSAVSGLVPGGWPGWAGLAADVWAIFTGEPGRAFTTPSTITWSPGLRPSRMIQSSPDQSPT